MRILGIDPGGKTGWAVYCTRARAVVQSGCISHSKAAVAVAWAAAQTFGWRDE